MVSRGGGQFCRMGAGSEGRQVQQMRMHVHEQLPPLVLWEEGAGSDANAEYGGRTPPSRLIYHEVAVIAVPKIEDDHEGDEHRASIVHVRIGLSKFHEAHAAQCGDESIRHDEDPYDRETRQPHDDSLRQLVEHEDEADGRVPPRVAQ